MKDMHAVDRRPPRSGIEDEEIQKLLDKGLNKKEIADWFTERGRRISPQAVGQRVQRILDEEDARTRYVMPWVVRSPLHAQGWVYRAAVAYGKMRQGKGVSPQELRWMRELEEFLATHEAVLTYDYNKGFMLRNRRPGDGPSMLAR